MSRACGCDGKGNRQVSHYRPATVGVSCAGATDFADKSLRARMPARRSPLTALSRQRPKWRPPATERRF